MTNRFDPAGPPKWYQTYRLEAPISSHWRNVSCEEFGCLAFLHGWETIIDPGTDLGQKQYHYIKKESKRKFIEYNLGPVGIRFVFEAGQPCFGRDKHRIQNRPENYSMHVGDWRAQGPTINFRNHEDWLDHFAEHQSKINIRRQRG